MTREEALDNLKAPSSHVRGRAARALADVGYRTDLPRIQQAQRDETVTYVNYALQETIRRLTHEQAPTPSTDETDVVPEDLRKEIYGKAMEWITGFLLHEISSPIGLVRLAAKRELGERWEGSGTQKHLESVARVFDAIELLKNAASVPRPQEFDLSALVDELLDEFEPQIREWISTVGSRPFLIKSDPSLVRMVVVNGIRNAVEAQQEASEQPNVHAVTISWGDSDVDYWLAVLDHGAGLTGPIETAFEIGNSTKKNHIGFGLAIARQAVETMIGSLTIEPAKHGGALYTARWRK